MNWLRGVRQLALGLLLALAGLGVSRGADPPLAAPEYQVKAAFLLNFARFVEWPGADQWPADRPIVLGIQELEPFGEALKLIEGRTAQGHTLQVRHITSTNELDSCDLLFLNSPQPSEVRQYLRLASGKPILTIGETPGFASAWGGVIRLRQDGEHMQIHVNPAAARDAGLKVSSQLLEIARIVGNP